MIGEHFVVLVRVPDAWELESQLYLIVSRRRRDIDWIDTQYADLVRPCVLIRRMVAPADRQIPNEGQPLATRQRIHLLLRNRKRVAPIQIALHERRLGERARVSRSNFFEIAGEGLFETFVGLDRRIADPGDDRQSSCRASIDLLKQVRAIWYEVISVRAQRP